MKRTEVNLLVHLSVVCLFGWLNHSKIVRGKGVDTALFAPLTAIEEALLHHDT